MKNNFYTPITGDRPHVSPARPRSILSVLAASTLLFSITGCNNLLTDRYEATATVTYTWQVNYSTDSRDIPRRETFASTMLVNRNGQKPEGAVTGPDDRGLWWPALPSRPTVDDIEKAQKYDEDPSSPELLKDVKYHLSYQLGEETRNLPTNYQVYREVAKAYPDRMPLKFTLGPGDRTVTKASRE